MGKSTSTEIAADDAERLLDALLERVEKGERFRIVKAGKPVATREPPTPDLTVKGTIAGKKRRR